MKNKEYRTKQQRDIRQDNHIKRNMAQCLLCNEIIESKSLHDFVTCSCGNLSVDGGHDYIERSFLTENYIELSEFEESINMKNQTELFELLAESEDDVKENRVASMSDTFNDLRQLLKEE